MEEFKVTIEVENELEELDRFEIENVIWDALSRIGIKVTRVKVPW